MSLLPSPIPQRYLEQVPALAPIHDAFEAEHGGAMSMLVGQPATMSNGADSYRCRVTRVTAKRIHVAFDHLKPMVFRPSGDAWKSGKFRFLDVGIGETKVDLDR